MKILTNQVWLLVNFHCKVMSIYPESIKKGVGNLTSNNVVLFVWLSSSGDIPRDLARLLLISIYTLSDLGVLSNLIGSLSLANEHYSPPTEWIMRKPNKNKMASVNSCFASVSESIFNGFLLKMLLRSLPVYILKQLFFSISVNSGRIFTSPLRGSGNILPLFTSISKNNC